jgi:hypothetical protein
MYSKRLLLPYVGVMQVAEFGRAKALSVDGDNWAIGYALTEHARMRNKHLSDDPRLNYSPVATIKEGRLQNRVVHSILDPDDVRAAVSHLYEALSNAQIPFAAQDRYEYWLLDSDDRPLALLQSTVDVDGMQQPPPRPTWIAMPAAQLEVEAPEPPQNYYIPPVNYRLQQRVEERAGAKPRAAWFERSDPAGDDFPPCLVREDWEDETDQQLCDRYIQRLAPRLLMMHGLAASVRQRLEQSARHFVFDVERFYPLYPEVVDKDLLTAARVEARMRRASET